MALKLYEYQNTHYAPRDSSSGILGYFIAVQEDQVYDRIAYNQFWMDRIEDDCADLSDEKKAAVYASRKAEIMANRGNWEDELTDLYYGGDHYGWSKGVDISEEDAAVLVRLGIAERLDLPD